MDVAKSMLEYEERIREIFSRGGPEPSEYEFLTNVPKESSQITLEEQSKIYDFLSPLLNSLDCMIGFAFQKPHGYAGDYEIINRIYSKRKSTNDNLVKWDEYYHELDAPIAVRNRKEYFTNLVKNSVGKKDNSSVLNLGSGPCSDLHDYLVDNPGNTVSFECLDMDNRAIEYGSNVCNSYLDKVSFINQNAFRFRPERQYDLIWSAGMFDYFSDKLFIRLLNRMYALVNEGGELVVGNFSSYNPSQNVMEVFTQWYLHHRSEETLIELALQAGVNKKNISVKSEDRKVNLFLHLQK